MQEIRRKREVVGLSQIALAHRAGVSRMRLQLAEAGEIVLRPEEISALRDAIKNRAALLHQELLKTGFLTHS